MNDWHKIPLPPQSQYTYSNSITIKEWPGGSIIAQVGFVREHPEKNKIVLTKSWTGKGGNVQERSYNIDKGDWGGIKDAVERLLPEIGETPTADSIDKTIQKVKQDSQLLDFIAQHPDLLASLPEDVNILSLPAEQKVALIQLITTGSDLAKAVIAKLAKQPVKDIEHFSQLLDELKLSTINSLVTHITGRIQLIGMFEKVILNDSSYERRGRDSVHSILRQNMWLVDPNYLVLHDDETLKAIIKAQWDKDMSDIEENKRPDFLCMTDRHNQEDGYKKLVIIEIKRPTVDITLEHVHQVMRYKTLLQKNTGNNHPPSFTCYIIGREIHEDLKNNPLTDSGFITKTYSDFIGDTRKFYSDYLKIIKVEDYAF